MCLLVSRGIFSLFSFLFVTFNQFFVTLRTLGRLSESLVASGTFVKHAAR